MSGEKKKILHVTVVTERQTSKKSFEVDSVIVGRNPDCLLPISHHDISRRHLTIWVRGQEVWIEDMGSSNGTFVNGARLVAHAPQTLFPADKVNVGASTGISLLVELEIIEPLVSAPEESDEILEDEPSEHAETIIFAAPSKKETPKVEMAPVPEPEPMAPMPTPPPAASPPKAPTVSQAIEINRLLQEAKREAAEIIRMAKLEAEHKVQEIFEHAEKTQTEAEDYYRQRMQEAYRDAESARAEARTESEHLLEKTKKACDEVRRQANAATTEIRSRTRKECDVLLREAEAQARLMKEQRQQEAEAALARKEEQLTTEIKESMALSLKANEDRIADELQAHQEKINKEQLAHRNRIEEELKSHQDKIQSELADHKRRIEEESLEQSKKLSEEAKSHAETMAQELSTHEEKIRHESSELSQKLENEKKRFETETADLRAEHSTLTEENASFRQKLEALKSTIEADQKDEEERKERLKGIQEQIATTEKKLDDLDQESLRVTSELDRKKREFESLTHQFGELSLKKEKAEKEIESELLNLKAKLEAAKAKMTKEEEEQLVYLKLETAKRVQQTEKEMLSEIARKKNAFVREILVSLEKSSSVIADKVTDWRKEAASIEENLLGLIDGQLFAMKVEGVAAPQKIDLSARRRKERAIHIGSGAVVGMLVLFLGLQGMNKLKGPSPLERAVASEAEARKKDLENRRFNPAKTRAWRETYTDSVIYTDRYVELSTSDDYQKKWSLAAAKHLLKLWKVDEDSSLQVVSISNALVKSLAERKEKIHPDYVNDGLRKMKEAEDEAVKRISGILGSQVRFESLKKYEKEFFLAYRDGQ